MKSACLASIVCLLISPAYASVFNVPANYGTIQSAVDAAVTGDTILVAPGTYTGEGNRDIDFGGKNLVLKSEQGPELTIIDCQASAVDQHMAIHLQNGEDSSSVIDGFTVTGAFIDTTFYNTWAAIMCESASPTIRNCIVRDNSCGGISYFSGPSTARVYSTRIINNGYNESLLMTGLVIRYTPVIIDSCRIDSNAYAGAYFHWPNPIYMHNTTVSRNPGDGVMLIQGLGWESVDMANCTFSGNLHGLRYEIDAPKSGDVPPSIGKSGPAIIRQCLFTYNRALGFWTTGGGMDHYFNCNVLFGNELAQLSIPPYVAWDSTNTFLVNPLYCDTSSDDFSVSANSICLAANNPCAVDIGNVSQGCGPCCKGLRGNVDYDPEDNVDIADIVYLVEYAFVGGPPPACFNEADVTGDGSIDIGDLIFLVEWSMAGGPAPASCP